MTFEGCKQHCSDILKETVLCFSQFSYPPALWPYRAQLQLSTCKLHVAGLFTKVMIIQASHN